MKKLSFVLLLSVAAAIAVLAVGIPSPQNVTFIWSTPTDQPWQGLTYRLYGTTNLTSPMSTWPVVAVITNPSLSVSGSNLSYSIPIQPGAWYFTLTSANMWGEGPFSNLAATPPLPPVVNSLQISKGP